MTRTRRPCQRRTKLRRMRRRRRKKKRRKKMKTMQMKRMQTRMKTLRTQKILRPIHLLIPNNILELKLILIKSTFPRGTSSLIQLRV